MSEANGNSPSEHPEQPPPSERITEPALEEIRAPPPAELVLVLLRKLNNLADQRFEEIEFKRQIVDKLDILEALETRFRVLESRVDSFAAELSRVPKRGEQ